MQAESRMFCTFEAAGRRFGIPLIDIKEITAETYCTRIPHAPESVQGYVNIRGQIVLALDLRRILELPTDGREAKRLVIFKSTVGPAFGLLVDEIGEIESIPEQHIAHELSRSEPELQGPRGLIDYVCRLPNQLLVVLNPRKLLPIIEKHLTLTNL
jgi:purine-binding chemotaxis protein CheW